MPLAIALITAALLLAVPVGLAAFLLSFRAVGPWRTQPRVVPLPDLADERQDQGLRTTPFVRRAGLAALRQDEAMGGSRTLPFDRWPDPADARSAA